MRKKVSNGDPSDRRVMNLVTHHVCLSNCLVGLSIIIGSQILHMTMVSDTVIDSWNAKGLARIEYA
jgi:hypothetical protein